MASMMPAPGPRYPASAAEGSIETTGCLASPPKLSKRVACPEGLEPPTCCLEGSCSIQLSYGQ
jgi:hypothetical protein